jgi:hypothetical protein
MITRAGRLAFQAARNAQEVCRYRAARRTKPTQLQGPATGWLRFLRRVVAQAATPIFRIYRIAGIPICCRDFGAGDREQKLLPHFGEACTTIFAVKHVEYS